jgi:hypothetical protein
MPDAPRPPGRPPLLIGEAHGRREVWLRALPAGVVAVTVPRTSRDGSDVRARVPVDRRKRVKPDRVDLVAAEPVEAFDPPAELSTRDLIRVLTTGTYKRWSTIEAEFGKGDAAWRTALSLIRCGAVILRCKVVQTTGFVPDSWRLTQSWAALREDKLAELRGHPDPVQLHAELVQMMSHVPELSAEQALLAATPPGRTLKVPCDSAAGTEDWRVYEVAVRTAVVWWQSRSSPQPLTAKALAGKALRNTKNPWTLQRRQAFSNLVGMPFDQALEGSETELRMRGPLRWCVGTVIADAAACRPWLGLPAHGLLSLGLIESNAIGVLLIENKDAFEQVCKLPNIADRWLCVWGAGYATHGLVAFLKAMAPLPVAAWQDLDAHGIRIIANLTERTGRCITPVGMDVDLYRSGTKYRQKPEKRADNLKLAEELSVSGPLALRALAAEIARNGGDGCEHETLYDAVLPSLPGTLEQISQASAARGTVDAEDGAGARAPRFAGGK